MGSGWYQKRRSCISRDVTAITRESAGITPELALWEEPPALDQKPPPGADRRRATGSRSSSATRIASRTDLGFRSMPVTREVEVDLRGGAMAAARAGRATLVVAFWDSDFGVGVRSGRDVTDEGLLGVAAGGGVVRGAADGGGGGGLPAARA